MLDGSDRNGPRAVGAPTSLRTEPLPQLEFHVAFVRSAFCYPLNYIIFNIPRLSGVGDGGRMAKGRA
jgi:hypothetical protein